MFLLKLLFRLWFLACGLWSSTHTLPPHLHHHQQQQASLLAAAAAPAPAVGIAARQGRRFSMEDRAVTDTGLLPPGRRGGCGPVNYTYAAGGTLPVGHSVDRLLTVWHVLASLNTPWLRPTSATGNRAAAAAAAAYPQQHPPCCLSKQYTMAMRAQPSASCCQHTCTPQSGQQWKQPGAAAAAACWQTPPCKTA